MKRSFTRGLNRRALLVLFMLLFSSCLPVVSAGGDIGDTGHSPVIGPGLRIMLSRRLETSWTTAMKQNRDLLPVLIRIDSKKLDTVTVWIEAAGGQVKAVSGSIIAAEVPVGKMSDLALQPGVSYLSRSGKVKPRLTLSVPEIKADQVHALVPTAYQGTDVIIGVIDTGIDYFHQDFINADGTSRILSIWDQVDGRGPVPSGQSFGTEYTTAQLNASIMGQGGVYTTATDGHGTHVTACAASNGRANGGFTGVAPDADLVFVKTTYEIVDVIAGVDYIIDQAEEAGKPCVINLSLGTHEGPHDGTDEFAESISNFAGPGRIIVAAAGNEYEDDVHIGYTAEATERSTPFTFTPGSGEGFLDIWYDPPGVIDFKVETFTLGGTPVGDTGWVILGNTVNNISIQNGGLTYGRMDLDASETANSNNSARHVVVSVYQSGFQSIGSDNLTFKLWTRGTGAFDAWNDYGFFGKSGDGITYSGNGEKTVGMPAVAADVIAVANYVTRNSWTGLDGFPYVRNETVDDIADSSSRGPSRDEARTGIKPEIAAPGTFIGAALSSTANGVGAGEKSADGKHAYFFGTSMSTPHVTGVAALMLEKKGSLTPAMVRTLITDNAVADANVGAAPNYTWGYGKLDALAAVQGVTTTAAGIPTGLVLLTAVPASLAPNGTSQSTVVSGIVRDSSQDAVPDNSVFNVEVTRGSGNVRALDEGDVSFATTATVETSGGSLSFVFRSGTVAGDTAITVTSQAGDAAGTVTIPLTSPAAGGGGSSGGGGGGCFIATAAYDRGSPDKLACLRYFRDSLLLKVPGGNTVVVYYYDWGPYAAEFINRHPETKAAVRLLLQPLVVGS